MSIFFKKFQKVTKNEKTNGKWYARPHWTGTITESDLAEEIEKRSTVHRADILAVIAALEEVMVQQLQDSKRVSLDRIGTFKMSFSVKPADEEKKFTANNITKARILFTPSGRKDRVTHTTTRAAVSGLEFIEWADDDSKKTGTSSSSSSSSSDSSSTSQQGGGDQQG